MESGISKKSGSWKNCLVFFFFFFFLIIDDYESVPFLRYNVPQSSLTWGQAEYIPITLSDLKNL
jgi:hypothetical protein